MQYLPSPLGANLLAWQTDPTVVHNVTPCILVHCTVYALEGRVAMKDGATFLIPAVVKWSDQKVVPVLLGIWLHSFVPFLTFPSIPDFSQLVYSCEMGRMLSFKAASQHNLFVLLIIPSCYCVGNSGGQVILPEIVSWGFQLTDLSKSHLPVTNDKDVLTLARTTSCILTHLLVN